MKPFSRPLVKRILFVLIISGFLSSNAFSQPSDENYLHLNKNYLLSYFNDGAAVATAPLRWNKQQWTGFAAFGGAALLLYTQDDAIQHFFERNQTTAGLKFSKNYIDSLATWYLAGIVGGMYIYGIASGNRHSETAALLTTKSVVLAGAYALLFKEVFQRQRPDYAMPPNSTYWGGPFDGKGHEAFPSGHATLAFAAATTLSAYYNNKIWVGITAYSLAGLVAVSRMYENKHWSSDVLAGAALGYAVGRLVYNRFNASQLAITPAFTGFSGGIALQYTF
jgi:membrane-associated phospholipid phosphatase